jgi:hypothetical protein
MRLSGPEHKPPLLLQNSSSSTCLTSYVTLTVQSDPPLHPMCRLDLQHYHCRAKYIVPNLTGTPSNSAVEDPLSSVMYVTRSRRASQPTSDVFGAVRPLQQHRRRSYEKLGRGHIFVYECGYAQNPDQYKYCEESTESCRNTRNRGHPQTGQPPWESRHEESRRLTKSESLSKGRREGSVPCAVRDVRLNFWKIRV